MSLNDCELIEVQIFSDFRVIKQIWGTKWLS